MQEQVIQYAALIPDASEQIKLSHLLDYAAQAQGFKPINPRDAHVTIGFNPDGFDTDALAMLKGVKDVPLESAAAQGLSRKHGNLHVMYAKNTKQIGVAIEFPSHMVNELKAKLKHTFDGRLSLSHMTIGVLDAQALGVDIKTLDAYAANNDFDAIQTTLDAAFSRYLQSDAGKPLQDIAQTPISLSMEKVHASAHTECPLDITDHPNPISTRPNALEQVKKSSRSTPIQALSSWAEQLFAERQVSKAASARLV